MDKKKLLLNAVVAGVLTVGLSAHVRADGDGKKMDMGSSDGIECHGGNMCKGKGDCGGPGYSCAGNNKCLGKGFVNVKSQAECDALKAKVAAKIKQQSKSKAKAKKA